jgi:hypothetical protein
MTVLEIYGITQEELVSDSRRWNKTHPTVLSGINRITGLIKFDKRVRNAYYILSSGYNPCV